MPTFGGDEYVRNFDCGDGVLGVCTYQNLPNRVYPYVQFLVLQLYLIRAWGGGGKELAVLLHSPSPSPEVTTTLTLKLVRTFFPPMFSYFYHTHTRINII